MDRVGVTVKEAWVKAKVVCRKKGVQMVLSWSRDMTIFSESTW